jgi:predicted secreted protein
MAASRFLSNKLFPRTANRRISWARVFPVVLAVLSTRCSSPTSPDAVVNVYYSEFERQPNYSGSVQLAVGGTLTVALPSAPASTGFDWSTPAQINDLSVLSQLDHRYVPPSGGGTGAAGLEIWTFRALKKGNCTVYLEYSQPWNGGVKALWTFRLAVAVL